MKTKQGKSWVEQEKTFSDLTKELEEVYLSFLTITFPTIFILCCVLVINPLGEVVLTLLFYIVISCTMLILGSNKLFNEMTEVINRS